MQGKKPKANNLYIYSLHSQETLPIVFRLLVLLFDNMPLYLDPKRVPIERIKAAPLYFQVLK